MSAQPAETLRLMRLLADREPARPLTEHTLAYARWYLAALKRRAHEYPRLENVERIAVAKVAALLERGGSS